MDHLWIGLAVLAAFFQSLRLAGLKVANQSIPVLPATFMRGLFGLPVMVAYLVGVLLWESGSARTVEMPSLPPRFWLMSVLAGLGQYFGTALLVYAFQLRNFAVGTMLVKADVIMTAVIGSLLFSERISASGWVAILVTVAGVLIVSAGRLDFAAMRRSGESWGDLLLGYPTRICLVSAMIYATSYLTLREALLAIEGSPMARSAWSAVGMTVLQLLVIGPWLLVRHRADVMAIGRILPLAVAVGTASALGTIFWFLATAYTNASYVAAVAQVQIAFTLAISSLYFRERIMPLEIVGMAGVLAGIVLFRFA